jgi:FlaA1/EpsC-like NDP-sugar epimerase
MLQRIYRFKEALRNLHPLIRRGIKIVADACLLFLSLYLAYLVRFNWVVVQEVTGQFPHVVPVFVVVTLLCLGWSNNYSGFWVWWSVRELKNLAVAIATATAIVLTIDVFFPPIHVPRSVYILYAFFSLGSLTLLRLFARLMLEIPDFVDGESRKRLLIIGAGRAAEMLISQMLANPGIPYSVEGLIDDDHRKKGRSIHGIRVIGNRSAVPEAVHKLKIDEILIALPTARARDMRSIVSICEKAGVPFKTIPGARELMDGKVTLNRVRNVNIDDLLGREQNKIDMERVAAMIRNRAVLVTGAAGSIGSEMCRQIIALHPSVLVALDINENGMFYLDQELREKGAFVPIVASAGNAAKMERLFEQYRPSLVFHAAAYKHVPAMEQNPTEAVMNNVESTMILANAAREARVDKFVQISTDKAVNPTNIMGATKRLCELYCQHLSKQGHNAFLSVRFGNVIGSQGSVVTIFEKQIREGRPITVTHPRMKRYFMSIQEACRLVLESAAIGTGGYIYILDMGKPIRIVDLAKHMIRLAGLVPGQDIPIRFTGTRPGEKMDERLWYAYEKPQKTLNSKIKCTNGSYPFPPEFIPRMREIVRHSRRLDTAGMVAEIRKLIPEYSGNGFMKNALPDPVRRPANGNGRKIVRPAAAGQKNRAA